MKSSLLTPPDPNAPTYIKIPSMLRIANSPTTDDNTTTTTAQQPVVVDDTHGGDTKPFDHASKNIVFLFGGPGSRKGEIVDILTREYGARLFTADEVRVHAAEMQQEQQISVLECLVRHALTAIEGDTTHPLFLVDCMQNVHSTSNTVLEEDMEGRFRTRMVAIFERAGLRCNFALLLKAPDLAHDAKRKASVAGVDEMDHSKLRKRLAIHDHIAAPFIELFRSNGQLLEVTIGAHVPVPVLEECFHEFLLSRQFVSQHTGGASVLVVAQTKATYESMLKKDNIQVMPVCKDPFDHNHVEDILRFFSRSRDNPRHIALVDWGDIDPEAADQDGGMLTGSLVFDISLLYIQELCFKCVVLADVGMFAFERCIPDSVIYHVVNRFRFSW